MLCFCDVFASGPLNFEWLAEFRVRPNAAYSAHSNISGAILVSSGLMPMRLFLKHKQDTRSRVLLEFILPLDLPFLMAGKDFCSVLRLLSGM